MTAATSPRRRPSPRRRSTRARRAQRGASLIGYGLIVGLIAVVAIGAITGVGDNVQTLFDTVDTALIDARSGSDGSGDGDAGNAATLTVTFSRAN